jgi:hypothetical protein
VRREKRKRGVVCEIVWIPAHSYLAGLRYTAAALGSLTFSSKLLILKELFSYGILLIPRMLWAGFSASVQALLSEGVKNGVLRNADSGGTEFRSRKDFRARSNRMSLGNYEGASAGGRNSSCRAGSAD